MSLKVGKVGRNSRVVERQRVERVPDGGSRSTEWRPS